MVSICERSINVVILDKPKMLTGLGQKGTVVRYRGSRSLLSWTPATTGEQSEPNPSSLHTSNMVSPYRPFRGRQPQGGPTAMRVKEGGASERRAVIARIGGAPITTVPHAKAG